MGNIVDGPSDSRVVLIQFNETLCHNINIGQPLFGFHAQVLDIQLIQVLNWVLSIQPASLKIMGADVFFMWPHFDSDRVACRQWATASRDLQTVEMTGFHGCVGPLFIKLDEIIQRK